MEQNDESNLAHTHMQTQVVMRTLTENSFLLACARVPSAAVTALSASYTLYAACEWREERAEVV